MDILTKLNPGASYSATRLQLILAAWVLSDGFRRQRVALHNGDVAEDDYTKQSIYSLLYAMYRAIGQVKSETGEEYEFTFNTWGYTWPEGWGPSPVAADDPQRFGRNAYTGLFASPTIQDYVRARDGRVHVVELGCGTGAGAHHICKSVLPKCTYEAVDMQRAAIETCRRRFVPELGGRLVATHADVTRVGIADGVADIVVICETHITEHPGRITDEDKRFFDVVRRVLKPGGFLVWGNAIPDATWQPAFDYLASIGIQLRHAHDVTAQAIAARDEDHARVEAYVEQCLERFHGFRIPFIGRRKRREAEQALKNFYRHPGTNLYETMKDGTDSYRVVLAERAAP
ncbi:MAG: methyltransferase domain-containing protein [Deltaproteobacteria bacterium]|nr:methyltransferase domain-containing protein [Deltaproteobacteria bacterium]